jgi:hypothetical protein
MAELEPSKLVTRVRFPSPAPPSFQVDAYLKQGFTYVRTSSRPTIPPGRCSSGQPSASQRPTCKRSRA